MYDGPLAMASDYMVFHVSKDDIRVRRAAINEDIWPLPATRPEEPDSNQKGSSMSNFIKSGDYFMEEELRQIWDEVNRNKGTDVQLPSSSVF